MTSEESRRLELAYHVWHEAKPSEADVDRAVRRLQNVADLGQARGARRRRVGPAFAIAVALGAVLAYAAPGPRASLEQLSERLWGGRALEGRAPPAVSNSRSPGSPPPLQPAEHSEADVARPMPEPPRHGAAKDKGTNAPAGGGKAASKAARRTTATGNATWQDVNRALAAGDDRSARDQLRKLERTGPDQATRAKARLGLAQLALGNGDCVRARRLARAVAATPNLDEKIVQRAHTVLLRCELR